MASNESKLLYSATMSLDGFIAGAGGDMSWLTEYLAGGPEIDELAASIGALLVGKRTFQGDDPNRGTDAEGAFSGTWHGPSIVLTHELGEGYSVLPLKLAIERPNDVCVSPEKARPRGHLLGREFAPSHKVTVRRTSGARRIVHLHRDYCSAGENYS